MEAQQENGFDTTLSGASAVIESLIELGVDTVFGYPGGAVIPLYHEWVKYERHIQHYRASHEQHAVHAADGYARATGKVGVCIVTSGPGATNTVTGIATAYMDSIPLVVICGQVPSHLIGKDAFQEIDITGMTLGITKHNFLVRTVEDLPQVMAQAFDIAASGRPGPVLIDIPKDLFTASLFRHKLRPLTERGLQKANEEVAIQFEKDLHLVAQWLNEAKRPLIYAGGGVKSARAEGLLKTLAERLSAPVATSFMGNGTLSRRHPLAIGMIGMHGSVAANEAVAEADLVLAIGVRFSDRVVGNPAGFKIVGKVVHIDLDPREHGKNLRVDLAIQADVKAALRALLPMTQVKMNSGWSEQIRAKSEKYPQSQGVRWLFDTINEADDGKTIYCTDVGQHQMWSAQLIQLTSGYHWVSSGGLGTMGFGLGAAFGARVGKPDHRVVLITGDGSFRMNMAEMSSLMDYRVKVDIILLDNHALGMVRQWQSLFQDHVYSQTEIKGGLDYSALAHAFGLKAFYCKEAVGLAEAIHKSKLEPGSTLTVVELGQDVQVLPIVPPGRNFDEMILK